MNMREYFCLLGGGSGLGREAELQEEMAICLGQQINGTNEVSKSMVSWGVGAVHVERHMTKD